MYLLFQFQIKNGKKRLISEFEMDFKKSCFSSSLNCTYISSENRCAKILITFLSLKSGQSLENQKPWKRQITFSLLSNSWLRC